MLALSQRLKMLECPIGPVDLVIDTDAYNEIDDQFAISYALKATEKLNLKALYAAPFLNQRSASPADGMEKSYQEILKLLDLCGKSADTFRGSDAYLPDEMTPVESPAARDLIRRAQYYTSDRPLYVLAIGAITNVASALLLSPDIAERIVVVWLGGHALEWCDNAEFNIRQDVAAARVVFDSGAPLVILPCMGVVSSFTTTEWEMNHWIKGKNALCDYLTRNTVDEANQYANGRVWSRVLWDVTTVGWLLNDDGCFMKEKLIPTPIPEYDHHYAQSSDRTVCKYVYHINRDALLGDLFAKLVR